MKCIVQSNNIVPLRKLNNEDVTLGMWIAPYHMDYVDMKRYIGGKKFPCSPRAVSTFIIYNCLQSSEMMYTVHNCLDERHLEATLETHNSTK